MIAQGRVVQAAQLGKLLAGEITDARGPAVVIDFPAADADSRCRGSSASSLRGDFGKGVIRHHSPRFLIASRTFSLSTPRNLILCLGTSSWSSSSASKASGMLSGSGRIRIALSSMIRSTALFHWSCSSCLLSGSRPRPAAAD